MVGTGGEVEIQPAVGSVVVHWLSTAQRQACFNYIYTRTSGGTEGMRTKDLNEG